MNDTDQLAAEAADLWCKDVETEGPPLDPMEKALLIERIQAAIEKATAHATSETGAVAWKTTEYAQGWDDHVAAVRASGLLGDTWHPASEPPTSKDFEPTGYVVAWNDHPRGPTFWLHWREWKDRNFTHWKRLTPPKQ